MIRRLLASVSLGLLLATLMPAAVHAASGDDIAAIARAQLGKGCSGNGWYCSPGNWCSDFARWVWGQAGVPTAGLTSASVSFVTYGRNNNTITGTPHVGDAIVYNYDSGREWAQHVNLVVATRADGMIQTVGGNQTGGVVTIDNWHLPQNYIPGVMVIVRPVGVGTGPPVAGPGSTQVVITGWDDNLYHEIRYPDGNWTGFGSVGRTTRDVSITGMRDGSAQLAVIGGDGRAYHAVRYRDGNWSAFGGIAGIGTPDAAGAKAISIAGMPNGSAQLLIVGSDDRVYHQIRYADGNWSGFQPLPGIGTPDAAGAKAVSITGLPNGSAQVLIVGLDNRVYHEIRYADGNWSGFAGLPGIGSPDPAGAIAVGIAGMGDNSAQVVIVGLDNRVYHEIRYPDGNWTGFAPLADAAKDVGIAGLTNNSAQVVVIGQDDRVYHEVRYADGNWSGLAGLPGIGSPDPAGAKHVAIGGMP